MANLALGETRDRDCMCDLVCGPHECEACGGSGVCACCDGECVECDGDGGRGDRGRCDSGLDCSFRPGLWGKPTWICEECAAEWDTAEGQAQLRAAESREAWWAGQQWLIGMGPALLAAAPGGTDTMR